MPWIRRFRDFFRPARLDRDIQDELQFHIDMRERENLAAGMPPAEARRDALRRFGNLTLEKDRVRDRDVHQWLDTASQNLRYAARTLRKSPGFTAVAVLSIAIGIGANTAIFSLLNALLLKTLPVRDPQQLAFVKYRDLHYKRGTVAFTSHSYPVYQDLRARSTEADLFAFSGVGIDLTWNGDVERIDGHLVSGNYFEILGVQPAAGRLIVPADDRVAGGHPVAVLSHAFWQARFGADPSAIGRGLLMNGRSYTVIGVAARGFSGLDLNGRPDVFVPMMMQPQIQGQQSFLDRRGRKWLGIGARLHPGVSLARAQAALTSAFVLIEKSNSAETAEPLEIVLNPAGRGAFAERDRFADALYALMAAVGLVLLIACANVANLTLARSAARRRELSVRLAIGAGRSRLVAQLMTESLAIAVLGGILGTLLAYAADVALVHIFSTGARALPLDVQPDARVLAFTLAVSVLTGVLFGIFPAISSARGDVNLTLKEDTHLGSRRRLLVRRALVVAQVALSLVLLAGAGLFLKTLRTLQTMDIGYTRHGVLLADLDPRQAGFRGDAIIQFYEDLLDRVRRIPGIDSAGVAGTDVLGNGGISYEVVAEGSDHHTDAYLTVVSSGYLEAIGMHLLAGRSFTTRDNLPHAPKTIIVNEALARLFFGNQNPLGRRLGLEDVPNAEIIGIVRNAKYRNLREDDHPMCYIPPRQSVGQAMGLHIRTAIDPLSLVAPIRREVRALNDHLPLSNVRTLEEQSDRSLVEERLVAALSSAFGVIALALAVVGLYGVLSFMVARRTGEIGIRMALGARRADVIRLVLHESVALVLTGIFAGACVARPTGRLVKGLLFGVSGTDAATLSIAAAVLLITALIAAWIPARRASRIEPVRALRYE